MITATMHEPTGQGGNDCTYSVSFERRVCNAESRSETIYQELETALGVDLKSAPDEWAGKYNLDFVIEVNRKFIGLQIKPAGHPYITEIIKELKFQEVSHGKFTEKFGGHVFYVISVAEGKNKVIQNPEVIEAIRSEIERLQKS